MALTPQAGWSGLKKKKKKIVNGVEVDADTPTKPQFQNTSGTPIDPNLSAAERKQFERTPTIPPEAQMPPMAQPTQQQITQAGPIATPKIIAHPDGTYTEITYDDQGVKHYADYSAEQWRVRLGLLGAEGNTGGMVAPGTKENVADEKTAAAIDRVEREMAGGDKALPGDQQIYDQAKSGQASARAAIEAPGISETAEAAEAMQPLQSEGDQRLSHGMTLGTSVLSKAGAIAGGSAAIGAKILGGASLTGGAAVAVPVAVGVAATLAAGEIAWEYNYRKSDLATSKATMSDAKVWMQKYINDLNNPEITRDEKIRLVTQIYHLRDQVYAAEALLQQKSFIEKIGYSHEDMIDTKTKIADWKRAYNDLYLPDVQKAIMTPNINAYDPNLQIPSEATLQ